MTTVVDSILPKQCCKTGVVEQRKYTLISTERMYSALHLLDIDMVSNEIVNQLNKISKLRNVKFSFPYLKTEVNLSALILFSRVIGKMTTVGIVNMTIFFDQTESRPHSRTIIGSIYGIS